MWFSGTAALELIAASTCAALTAVCNAEVL